MLEALRALGGSGSPDEVRAQVASTLAIPDQEQNEALSSGASRFDNQVAWARFYLTRGGYLDASRRGVWTLTDKGQTESLAHDAALRLFKKTHKAFQSQRRDRTPADEENALAVVDEVGVELGSHREVLIATLRALQPAGFERLCQRLLRESGFQQVTVTGRSGDGGIDGNGVVEVNPFVSFRVLFQCKRYAGSVVPSEVRDFRGAMAGRADKGIVITTGSFTAVAREEAIRDGVPPIELVDGEKLVTMFETLELGLTPRKAYDVDDRFFDDFRR